jgi:hypothetical protein
MSFSQGINLLEERFPPDLMYATGKRTNSSHLGSICFSTLCSWEDRRNEALIPTHCVTAHMRCIIRLSVNMGKCFP